MPISMLSQLALVFAGQGTGQSLARLDCVDVLVIAIYFATPKSMS